MPQHTELSIHQSLARLYALALEQFNVKGPTEVGKLFGESSQTVNNWGRKGVSKLGAAKIQEQLGWSSHWIRDGVGPRYITTSGAAPPALSPVTMLPPRLVRRVPIVGRIVKRRDHLMVEEFKGDLEAIAAYTGGASSRALLIETDDFFPRVRQGEYVIIADDATAEPGDDVVIHLRDGKSTVMLYQYLYEADGVKVFMPFNSTSPVTLRKDAIVLIEPIMGMYNKRAKLAAIGGTGK